MEAHPTEFHNSNLANIESKIKSKSCDVDMDSIKGAFAAADNGKGAVPFATMKGLLAQFDLNDHEILTIARKYAQQDATKNDIEKTKSLVQEKLRKEVKNISILQLIIDNFRRLKTSSGYSRHLSTKTLIKAES